MSSDQLSLSDDVPATVTSYLPNGGLEILELRILAGERMAILVSFTARSLASLTPLTL